MKRILITGATGLIGKELPPALSKHDFDVFAIAINSDVPANDFHWHQANLFDEQAVNAIVSEVKPEYLLNLAWTTTGDYLSSDINYSFLTAGINLARAFVRCGGKRAVFAGTCFEYKFKNSPLKETDALDVGKTNYTYCKNALRETAGRIFASAGIEFSYGRIFYVYGRNEASSRLTASIISKLKKGEEVVIKAGPLKKDYIYTKDIANAFVTLADSNILGPVNICTGEPITIKEYVTAIANKIGRPDLLKFEDDFGNQPPIIVGDNTRLVSEVGYRPTYSLNAALDEILEDQQ